MRNSVCNPPSSDADRTLTHRWSFRRQGVWYWSGLPQSLGSRCRSPTNGWRASLASRTVYKNHPCWPQSGWGSQGSESRRGITRTERRRWTRQICHQYQADCKVCCGFGWSRCCYRYRRRHACGVSSFSSQNIAYF
jgi:hypothetical protein